MIADPITAPVVDACTLNNALNVAQLVVLVRLVQWVTRDKRAREGPD